MSVVSLSKPWYLPILSSRWSVSINQAPSYLIRAVWGAGKVHEQKERKMTNSKWQNRFGQVMGRGKNAPAASSLPIFRLTMTALTPRPLRDVSQKHLYQEVWFPLRIGFRNPALLQIECWAKLLVLNQSYQNYEAVNKKLLKNGGKCLAWSDDSVTQHNMIWLDTRIWQRESGISVRPPILIWIPPVADWWWQESRGPLLLVIGSVRAVPCGVRLPKRDKE